MGPLGHTLGYWDGHIGARWSSCGPAMSAKGQVCHDSVLGWVTEGQVGHPMVLQ
jgi:hypothetical protein